MTRCVLMGCAGRMPPTGGVVVNKRCADQGTAMPGWEGTGSKPNERLSSINGNRIRTYDLAVISGETGQAIKRRNRRPDNNLASIRNLRNCCNS